MLYGWIEVGASNNALFSNTSNEDIIIRTIQPSNKIIMGNTASSITSAAVYITGNNVGINKVPDSNIRLDVNGMTVLHTCQIGLSNLATNLTLHGGFVMKDTAQPFDLTTNDAVISNSNGVLTVGFQNALPVRMSVTDGNGMTLNDTVTITRDVFAPAFNLLSDRSLKNDIKPSDPERDVQIHCALEVVDYKINNDTTDVKGFIAQDVALAFPGAVKGTKPKTIDMFQLVALNTSVIQTLTKRIEILEKYMEGNK